MFKSGAPVFHPLNNGGTAAILFCFACLYLWTAGAGPISLDAVVQKRKPVGSFEGASAQASR
jgi:putative oxidoreductase